INTSMMCPKQAYEGKRGKPGQNRTKVHRRLLLVPGTIVIFGFLYPWGPWFFQRILDDGKSIADQCEYLSLGVIVVIYSAVFTLLAVSISAILLRFLVSAIFVMLVGASGIGILGVWWLWLSYVTLLCPPLPHSEEILSSSAIGFIAISVAIFWFHLRPRLQRMLELNGHAWNFQKMEYSMLAAIRRPDGKPSERIMLITIVGGFIGLFLATLPIAEWLSLGTGIRDFFMAVLMWCLGYFFLGYLTLGQLYLIWLVHKKSKKVGGRMVVKELA
uniref:hypothetical protein n=1 Tax=Sedimenticola hydrogenitrophicus TaxID=2967975 RepID=UPI0021A7037A